MNWLNIELRTIRSPEYVGSSPTERATWLSVLAYCADQENGGRISGAAGWKDRQWQQVCGVTAREVRAATRLILIDGADVIAFAYPVEKEAEVMARRQAGREGGLRSAASKYTRNQASSASSTPSSSASSGALHGASSSAATEGEGEGERERKENEKENEKGKGVQGETSAESAAPSASATAAKKAPRVSAIPDAEWIAGLKADPAFAGIDIDREIAKCRRWCEEKRKTLSRQRVVNWLNRCERPLSVAAADTERGSVRPSGWGRELPLDPSPAAQIGTDLPRSGIGEG